MKIQEPSTIHERMEMLVDYFCRGNKTAFGRETDILPGVIASIVGGRKSKPSFELLQKIMTRYPEVKGEWLILGRGPMTENTIALLGKNGEDATYLTTRREPIGTYEEHPNEVIYRPASEWMQEYEEHIANQTTAFKGILDYLIKKDDSAEAKQLKELLPIILGTVPDEEEESQPTED